MLEQAKDLLDFEMIRRGTDEKESSSTRLLLAPETTNLNPGHATRIGKCDPRNCRHRLFTAATPTPYTRFPHDLSAPCDLLLLAAHKHRHVSLR